MDNIEPIKQDPILSRCAELMALLERVAIQGSGIYSATLWFENAEDCGAFKAIVQQAQQRGGDEWQVSG